jgi:hypothetical protein
MPATLTTIDGGRGYRLTGAGVLTAAEIIAIKDGVEADPALPRDLAYWLVDLSRVTELRLTAHDVRAIVAVDRRLARLMPSAVVAVVAPADVVFGLARMWEVLAEGIGWQTQVFREAGAAAAWVRGLPTARPQD